MKARRYGRPAAVGRCLAAAAVALALLSACAAPRVAAPGIAAAAADSGKTDISPKLLYELLLANIAAQRGRDETALKSLTRAAYISQDRRVILRAIAMSVRMDEHRRAIRLSRLLEKTHPDEGGHRLMLASALLQNGDETESFAMLMDIAARQPLDAGEPMLRAIASLLAEAPPARRVLPKFRRAIETRPPNAALQLSAALLAWELDEREAYRELLDAALQLQPRWELAAMLKLGDLYEAADASSDDFAEEFLRANEDAARFRLHYGRLLQHGGRTRDALMQFDLVLRGNPRSAEALFAAGAAHLALDEYDPAEKKLRESLALHPYNDEARLHLADVHLAREEWVQAEAALYEIASYELALEVELRHATLLAKRHGVQAGIRHLQALEARGDAEAVRVIIGQEWLYRDFDLQLEAMAVLDAGLERIPAQPQLLYNRGLLAAQMDLLQLHERDMRALLAIEPDNAHAYNALGYTLADKTERFDEALALITTALTMRPNDPYILDSMGWVQYRLGDNDLAIRYLQYAYSLRKNAEIAAHLGEVLWVTGELDAARAVWQEGLALEADNAVLLETMRRLLPAEDAPHAV